MPNPRNLMVPDLRSKVPKGHLGGCGSYGKHAEQMVAGSFKGVRHEPGLPFLCLASAFARFLFQIPISPPRVNSSKGSLLDHQGKLIKKSTMCLHLFGPCKKLLKWHEKGSGGFFPTKPDLANV